MGDLEMAGDGDKDFVGGDVGPTVSSDFKPGSSMDDGSVTFAGFGNKDLFGGKTDTTDQEADKGTPKPTGDDQVDFTGAGGKDVNYVNY